MGYDVGDIKDVFVANLNPILPEIVGAAYLLTIPRKPA